MKIKLLIFMVLLVCALMISSSALAQELITERPDLKQEVIELSKAFDFEEEELNNLDFNVYQFQGTVEEALTYVEKTLLKDDEKKPEMEYSQNNLSEMLAGIRSMSEFGVISPLDKEWTAASKIEEEKLKDIKQTVYYGSIEYPNLEKEISVESPFFNPLTFRLEEGTFIILSEDRLNGENHEQILGERTELENKLAEKFFQGNWTIQKRHVEDDYDYQVPQVKIKVDKLEGSIPEIEIEAVRYLFSGEIEIEGTVYEAVSELDPVNIYAYPIRIISICKEEDSDYQLEIWVEDIDKDLQLFIQSDMEEVYEKAVGVEIEYYGSDNHYDTEEEAVDYLIRE